MEWGGGVGCCFSRSRVFPIYVDSRNAGRFNLPGALLLFSGGFCVPCVCGEHKFEVRIRWKHCKRYMTRSAAVVRDLRSRSIRFDSIYLVEGCCLCARGMGGGDKPRNDPKRRGRQSEEQKEGERRRGRARQKKAKEMRRDGTEIDPALEHETNAEE